LNYNSAAAQTFAASITNKGSATINTHDAGLIVRASNDQNFTLYGKNG
jgi:hypothetical protein